MSPDGGPAGAAVSAIDGRPSAAPVRLISRSGKRNLWLLLVVLGFLAPMLLLSWYIFDLQRASVEKSLRLELEQMTRVFAQSTSKPIWDLIPAHGQAAVNSFMEDERVIAVQVTSRAQGEFLSARDVSRRRGDSIVLHQPVLHDGVEIGSVRVEVDLTHLHAKLLNQWDDVILILVIQVSMGLAAAVLVIGVFRRLERQEVLKDANLRLTQEVERHRRTERELIDAKTSAEDASQAKTRFLANMSHELRTPLNAVIGFSDIISQQRMGPVGQQCYVDYARDINNAGNHLLKIISDILDIARMQGGNAKISEEDICLHDLLDSCARLVDTELRKKRQTIAVDCPADMPSLRAGTRFVKQIILNLLSNSIKFTPEGGRIDVGVFVDDRDRISIRVADNGIGMTASEIGVALDPFGQINADHTLSQGGVGLGLPIAKALAEQHDASFHIESDKGSGTTITVAFPAPRTVPAVFTGKSATG